MQHQELPQRPPGGFGTPGHTELLSIAKKMIFSEFSSSSIISSAHQPLQTQPMQDMLRCLRYRVLPAMHMGLSKPSLPSLKMHLLSSRGGKAALLAQGAKPHFPNHPHCSTRQEHCNPAKDRGKGESRTDWEKDTGKVLSQRLQTTGNAGLYSLKTMLNFPCLSARALPHIPPSPGG